MVSPHGNILYTQIDALITAANGVPRINQGGQYKSLRPLFEASSSAAMLSRGWLVDWGERPGGYCYRSDIGAVYQLTGADYAASGSWTVASPPVTVVASLPPVGSVTLGTLYYATTPKVLALAHLPAWIEVPQGFSHVHNNEVVYREIGGSAIFQQMRQKSGFEVVISPVTGSQINATKRYDLPNDADWTFRRIRQGATSPLSVRHARRLSYVYPETGTILPKIRWSQNLGSWPFWFILNEPTRLKWVLEFFPTGDGYPIKARLIGGASVSGGGTITIQDNAGNLILQETPVNATNYNIDFTATLPTGQLYVVEYIIDNGSGPSPTWTVEFFWESTEWIEHSNSKHFHASVTEFRELRCEPTFHGVRGVHFPSLKTVIGGAQEYVFANAEAGAAAQSVTVSPLPPGGVWLWAGAWDNSFIQLRPGKPVVGVLPAANSGVSESGPPFNGSGAFTVGSAVTATGFFRERVYKEGATAIAPYTRTPFGVFFLQAHRITGRSPDTLRATDPQLTVTVLRANGTSITTLTIGSGKSSSEPLYLGRSTAPELICWDTSGISYRCQPDGEVNLEVVPMANEHLSQNQTLGEITQARDHLMSHEYNFLEAMIPEFLNVVTVPQA